MAEPNLTSVPDATEALLAIFDRGNRTLNLERLRRGEGMDPNWFRCADGTEISVVAGGGTYCSPRPGYGGVPTDYSGPFAAVEVWWPGADEPTGWVPVVEVIDFVREHGGAVAVASTQEEVRRVRT